MINFLLLFRSPLNNTFDDTPPNIALRNTKNYAFNLYNYFCLHNETLGFLLENSQYSKKIFIQLKHIYYKILASLYQLLFSTHHLPIYTSRFHFLSLLLNFMLAVFIKITSCLNLKMIVNSYMTQT